MSQIPAPPRELAALSGGVENFDSIGRDFVRLFTRLASLKSTDDMLDLGCGPGRMASPLTNYLTGSYDGLDCNAAAVRWCQQNISPVAPLFRFHCLDVRNAVYNPAGTIDPAEIILPFSDASFDFVCAVSLFTHVLPQARARYLQEIRRVTKSGGAFFATYFLIAGQPPKLITNNPYTEATLQEHEGCWVMSTDQPEAAVAYGEIDTLRVHRRAGLEVEAIVDGTWSGRRRRLQYQDLVISRAGPPCDSSLEVS